MDKQFWMGRWERGETGWHQAEVEPGLMAHFPKLAPTRVLVPLCGKSLDLAWLASQGHEVIGVELSPLAVRAFFDEQKIPFQLSHEGGGLNVYRSERITLVQGDFFEVTPPVLGKIGAVYDRAALIALPPEMRKKYSVHLKTLLAECAEPGFKQLQIVLERTPADENGPPFSVTGKEIEALYRGVLRSRLLNREVLEQDDARKVEECIYLLEP